MKDSFKRIGKDLSLSFEMTGIVILLSVGEPKVMTSVRHEMEFRPRAATLNRLISPLIFLTSSAKRR